jgi:signal peptidase I
MFVCTVPALLLAAPLLLGLSDLAGTVVLPAIALMAILYVGVIVDSYRLARRTKPDYELKEYNRWYVYALLVLINVGSSIVTAIDLRANYLEAFRVSTGSMTPTILLGDRFLANKIAYKTEDPKRGDVVVFANPRDRRMKYIKRVVALAGDTVEIRQGELFINGQKLSRQALGRRTFKIPQKTLEGEVYLETNGLAGYKIFLEDQPPLDDSPARQFGPLTVPVGHCFVLGDNRYNSQDSRHFGPVPITSLKGRADFLYFPGKDWSRFGKID